jgi:hypothetical protein
MQFSLRTKIILMCLLIALNLILRYPVYPHEIGWDSFAVHTMANSISEFGYAKWWIHPASIYGAYPYSTSPSAVPFVLSGISQCTSMDMEKVILLYSMILGIFSIFGAYLMAGIIWENDIFKFLVAMIFSTSQGMVTYSTWTANARTLFVIMLPLFIYLLLKTRTFKARFGILTSVILALLLVTHHYFYFTIPVVISFLIVAIFYTLGKHIRSIKIPENVANFAMLAGFLIIFSIPFFTRTLAEADPEAMAGGRYAWLFYMIEGYTRYIGFFITFVVSGYIYLVFKRNKRFEEWFLLFTLVGLAQFLYIITYMKWFIVPFISLLIGIALVNVAIAKTHTQKRKNVPSLILITILLLSISFTGYYQYIHFLNDPYPSKRYMEERTYIGALWTKDNIGRDKNMIAGSRIPHRLFAISEVPTLTGVGAADLAYGFVDPDKLEVKQIYSYMSVEYYMHDPYAAINHSYTGWYVSHILDSDINERMSWANRLIPKFNLSYYAENMDSSDKLSHSVPQTKDCLYDNGKIRIWELDSMRGEQYDREL